ncbi:hypothetical protein [Bacillus sp. S/N-304-OC-R1]|uniref:hypothetical protein n=1 Tax=Bacillus sp. S/N-304-OC-R1 TaxID=2758034 RepID=UPI001C8EA44B|nr:hypothetical protein [Bacillus sp. S/N-304-OC-R1]MBY0123012.1 hypothetical protein [Bacillus sp. S/N-304-OC-R1]
MNAPDYILSVWRKFDKFPMETLTKAWFSQRTIHKKQRDLSLMKEHRIQYGISGNCFDLAIWLLGEFRQAGIESYPIGHNLKTEKAHGAVIAVDEQGDRYLCDLGDQWINPILIDSQNDRFSGEKLAGFFPAVDVEIMPNKFSLEVTYYRPNGKISRQSYDTRPIDLDLFMDAAEFSQIQIRPKPLLEVRTPYKSETAHWEFYNWESFLSTTEGLVPDQSLETTEAWVERIHSKTGYDKQFLIEALNFYKELQRGG